MSVEESGHRLTSEAVEAVLKDALLDGDASDDAIIPEGIVHRYAFHPERLEEHRSEVEAWIAELPPEFLAGEGGGWSFLNLCNRADGSQWTGMHLHMEQLVALAEGLGLAKFQLPREVWSALPGGMPYVVFTKDERDG